jgi:hypothetical protein
MAAWRRRLVAALVLVVIGLVAFSSVRTSPLFAVYRTVDMVRLMASGACFGVALLMVLGGPRDR